MNDTIDYPLPPPDAGGRGRPSGPATPIVYSDGDSRVLMFSDGLIQSEMMLSRPYHLVLAYTRAMMAFSLFQAAPRSLLMVGLGGGSLAKFCRYCYPLARITVVELDPAVIGVRAQFAVPPDGPRFQVIQGDAMDYIASLREPVDVLMVDGFGRDGMPAGLGGRKFYDDCRRALNPGGVLVANIHCDERDYAGIVQRMGGAFSGCLCRFKAVATNNHIYFAVNPSATRSGLWPARGRWMQTLVAARGGFGRRLNRWLVRANYLWLDMRGARAARRRALDGD